MLVHLHIHSDYSLLESCITIPELVQAAASSGSTHLALVDRYTMAGTVEFHKACVSRGIQPLFGMEIPVAWNEQNISNIVLLAENDRGYRQLLRWAGSEDPLSLRHLEQVAGSVIALSGALDRGWFAHQYENPDCLRDRWKLGMELFGQEHFFVQVEVDTPIKKQRSGVLWQELKGRGAAFVGTQEGRLLRANQRAALDCMDILRDGDPSGPVRPLAHPDQLAAALTSFPGAVANTNAIATRCQVDPLGQKAQLPAGTDSHDLWSRAVAGLENRLGPIPREYRTRLEYEHGVISDMGFIDYFRIVADIVDGARRLGIPVGPGRGSAAGSLMAFALGITTIDPLQYGLMFERFLNRNRKTLPDIDLDFCSERRDEVVQWIIEKYGRGNTARIGTYGTFGARAALRDAARVLAVDDSILQACLKRVNREAKEPDWSGMIAAIPTASNLVTAAKGLFGRRRTASVHAAGVVIADQPVVHFSGVRQHQDGSWITEMDMDSIESLGLLKVDVLGLRTLTILDRATELVRERQETFNLDTIDLEDKDVYEYLNSQRPLGIFQLESPLFQDVLQQLSPRTMEDLITVLAIGRPGPLQFVPALARRRKGRETAEPLHPDLADSTASTQGLLLFQEQVMIAAHRIGGLDLAEADALRTAMSKKRPEAIREYKDKFVQGAQTFGLGKIQAEHLFRQIERFAGYAFNKAHSAAYARLSYQCAYLKCHFPTEFFAALLQCGENHDQRDILRDALEHGVHVFPVDIRYSKDKAVREGDGLRLGYGNVSGISTPLAKSLSQWIEKERPFASHHWFQQKVVPRDALTRLLAIGALNCLGSPRTIQRHLGTAIDVDKVSAQRQWLGWALPDEDVFGWAIHLQRFGRLFEESHGGIVVRQPSGFPGKPGQLLSPRGMVNFVSSQPSPSLEMGSLIACFGRSGANGYIEADWILPLNRWYIITPNEGQLAVAAAIVQQFPGNNPVILALDDGVYQLADEKLWVDQSPLFEDSLRNDGIAFTVLAAEPL